ncbi:hypothetical protein LUZ60_008047 [Juncus effusus]|nr:hypothetical protein LUZ60_008047 [Juncus effusus]
MAAVLNISIFIAICLVFFTSNPTLAQPAAPSPKASTTNTNITAVLEAGSQYTTFIRILKSTRVDVQLNSQLNNSFNGLTIFAPTDNAFSNLKAGTLNTLSEQEQIELILFHVLPRFYTIAMFATTSNPINTQASGSEGADTLNITSSNSQVNISTGVVDTPITTTLNSEFPLAVYSVDKVLLPYSLFGPKPPAAAPSPKAAKGGKNSTSGIAEPPNSSDSGSSNSATSSKGIISQWTYLVGFIFTSVIWGMV